ncbi:DNA-directed primase/polymerase protein [Glycine soja]|uniref:DNA-directed primase/polymerase protein n=1 Tax=Glycine soja TaxID=3848 RepID=A0A0B2SDU5_GLYSO|nr:DNA-directed primase/polymerase protein isoform X3 [Glycine soja]KHN42464.1 Coiled-coil domain-containing protein 111 like [Glycine soja]RZB91844.1 DNA-directed primase/polymerase protein isoform A [Glycine soja]
MSSSTTSSSNNNMSDVDRLFASFKCGLTPPKSATRERKRSKRRLEQVSSNLETPSESPGPRSPEEELRTPLSRIRKTNIESSIEKLKSAVTRAQSIGCGKQFSPIVFYGSPCGIPPKKPTRMLWRMLREICPNVSQQNILSIRKEVWMTFPRQDEAMKFAKGQEDVHVFSYQDHFNGQRRFLVSTYTEFWRRYNNMNPKFRHHYEVIQAGLPCHLYFDLEFNKKVNTGKNGEEMVDLLISVVLEAFHEKYAIQGDHDWVVELDSSNEDKFSRHIIVRIPKTAFKDNSHAGAFVSEICSRILNAREKDKSFEKLFVMKDSSNNESAGQLFVDTAVYSRNRCFRLPLSSKAGKRSVLLPTKRFKCKDLGEEDIFMASLICNMDVDCKTYLVCKTDLDCVKTLHFDTEENSNVSNSTQIPPEFTLGTSTSDVSTTYFMGKSPFPFLDKFILSVASVGNIPGNIHSWYYFSEFGLMVYSMTKNRYCERIGRQHKSNNVIYVVDLRMAVYYQKCHDPDCRGYRSPSRQIPVHVFSNPSDVIGSFGLLDDEQPVDDKLRHQLDDNKEQNLLQFKDTVEDNSNDSWWLEAIRVVEEMENKQTKTEEVIDEDEEWWQAVESTASQVELTCSSQQELCAI